MTSEAYSTYQLIKDLLRSGKRLSFTSDAFSHGQGAQVFVNRYPKEEPKEDIDNRISLSIYEFMREHMSSFGIYWVGDFEIEPRIDDDKLTFEVSYSSSNDNYWEAYDPIYQNIVIDLELNLSKALAVSEGCKNIDPDDLEIAVQLKYTRQS